MLEGDFSVKCHQGAHAEYMVAAFVFLCVYVFGVPASMFAALYRNKAALHDESHPRHAEVQYELGGLYASYEPRWYWFEVMIVLNKMIMTGALCVTEPGSPVQLLCAILISAAYLLLVLKLSPYTSGSEDWTAIVSCVALTLTLLGAFAILTEDIALKMTREQRGTGADTTMASEFEYMGYLLVAVNVLCMALNTGIVVLVDGGLYERLAQRCRRPSPEGSAALTAKSKVVPTVSPSSGGVFEKKDVAAAAAERNVAPSGGPVGITTQPSSEGEQIRAWE